MTIIVLGQLVAPEGLSVSHDAWGAPVSAAVLPPVGYLRSQRADLPIFFDHDRSWRLGSCQYLERSAAMGLMALGQLDADVADLLDDGRWFFSDQVICRRLGDSTLHKYAGALQEVSLVRRTANGGTRPIAWCRGDITRGTAAFDGPAMPLPWRDTWRRAVQALEGQRYRRQDHLTINDIDPLDEVSEALTSGQSLAQAGAVHTRAATPTSGSNVNHRPTPEPQQARVNWNGRPLTGEAANAVADAIEFGRWPAA